MRKKFLKKISTVGLAAVAAVGVERLPFFFAQFRTNVKAQ